nr:hypothetical protein [Tanacetum cinerariifolium]
VAFGHCRDALSVVIYTLDYHSLERFGTLRVVYRSGLVYCSSGLSGKYTVLAVCQIIHCASGLSFLTTVCLIRKSGLMFLLHSGLPSLSNSGLAELLRSGLSLVAVYRYNADIRATNILLQGLPKDIHTLINHYIDAKDLWDNVKMLLEGETIHDYYVWFAKLINDMQNIKMTLSRMQLNSKFVDNMLPEWGRFVTTVKLNRGLRDSNYDQLYAYLKQHEAHANENKMMLGSFTQHTGNKARGASTAGYRGAQNRVRNANSGQARQIKCYNYNGIGHIARNGTQPKRLQNSEYFKDKMLLMQAQENEVALDEEQLLFIAGRKDNAVDEDVDEQPVQDLALNVDNVFQANDYDAFDSDVDEAPTAHTMFMVNLSFANPIYDEAGPSYDSDILLEGNKARGASTAGYRGAQNRVRNANSGQARQIKCYNYNSIGHIARKGTQPKRLQNSEYFKDKMLLMQAQENGVALDEEQLLFIAGRKDNAVDEDVDEQPAPTAHTMFMVNLSFANPIYDEAGPSYDSDILLEAQITKNHKSNCVTIPAVKSKVLAPSMYVIDVKPIPPHKRNNKEVYLNHFKHLKESVATLYKIIKEARVEKPFDSSLASACRYNKHSKELVEYVIGTSPNDFNKGDKQIASTPVTKKKRVTFMDPCETSTHNNLAHVKQQTMNKTNKPVIPFTRVNDATAASGEARKLYQSLNQGLSYRPFRAEERVNLVFGSIPIVDHVVSFPVESEGAVDGRGITGLFGSMVGKLSSLERIDRQAALHAITIEEIRVEISERSPLCPYISSLSLAKKV